MLARGKDPGLWLSVEELKPYYHIKPLNLFNTLKFHATLRYNKLQNSWNESDEVSDHLFLGRVPEKILNPVIQAKLIVSVITYGELAEANFPFRKISRDGIRHVLFPIADFDSHFSSKALASVVKLMDEYISEGANVYIHCKAGRSRSGVAAACYLAYKQNISIDKAIDEISQFREQISVGNAKREKANEALSLLRGLSKGDAFDFFEDEGEYLSSLQGKNEICQLPSFKNLAMYLVNLSEKSKRAKYLKAFFEDILYSTDGKWYRDWQAHDTNLGSFASSKRIYSEKSKLRQDLISMFEQELIVLINHRINKKKASQGSQEKRNYRQF